MDGWMLPGGGKRKEMNGCGCRTMRRGKGEERRPTFYSRLKRKNEGERVFMGQMFKPGKSQRAKEDAPPTEENKEKQTRTAEMRRELGRREEKTKRSRFVF